MRPPPKPVRPPQPPAAVERDAAARHAWAELSERERAEIRRAAPRLYELNHLGDVSVAELLFALGQAGYLRALAEALSSPAPAPVAPRVRRERVEGLALTWQIVRYGIAGPHPCDVNGRRWRGLADALPSDFGAALGYFNADEDDAGEIAGGSEG